MKQPNPFALALLLCLALSACSDGNRSTNDTAVSFNWDVRPIIADNCFACHGPDVEGGQEAGLRLDKFESATAELPESPGKYAIVPGSLDESELIRRINSSDPAVMMPPPESNKVLSAAQKQTLTAWVEQGAVYERHWAYVPVQRPNVPAPAASTNNAIDAFIGERLAQAELTSAPAADKATLINRVYLDLTGLPPTLAAVDAFVADNSPDAWENLIDSLLASDAHAEHMAAQWLDIARWADTDGYLEDAGSRLLYPWRDWVIDAYRNNMPFNDFLTWQIAGDLLPNATTEQKLATAFLRLGQRSSENGIIEEEYKNEYAIDRVETLGVGILGHTVGCARCHDHKYDPISIKDFYSFAAFFSDTHEPGFYTPGGTVAAAGFLGVESGATLTLSDAATTAKLAELEAQVAARMADYANSVQQAQQRYLSQPQTSTTQMQQELVAAVDSALAAHYSFESVYEGNLDFAKIDVFGRQEPGKPMTVSKSMPAGIRENLVRLSASNLKGQVPAVLQSPVLGEGKVGQAFVFDEQNKGYFGGDVGDYDRTDAFTLDFWVRFAKVYDIATLLNHNQHIRFASNGYALDVVDNHLRFDLTHTPDNKLSVITEAAIAPNEWSHISVSYDGSSTAAGIKLYLNAQPLAVRVLADNLTKTIVTAPLAFIDDTLYGLGFGKRWQQYTLAGSSLDEVKVFKRDLSALEINWLHNAAAVQIASEQYREFKVGIDDEVTTAKESLRQVAAEHNQLLSHQSEIMVMGDNPLAPPMQVKQRGVYSDPGEAVSAQAFDQLFAWDTALPNNRLGLTQWLFDRNNPLTSRVQANRVWQQMFGRGIVETAEDFGTQGAVPSHPQLLDWLAAELMDSKWDTRHLLKLMAMSSTYRQSSDIDSVKREKDPLNQLLSRGVRLRQSAEIIRDNSLASSGLLDSTVGGDSVHPYQPPGVWLAVSVNQPVDYPSADQVPLAEHHRRTMYGYVKRASQHPSLQVFDFPQRTTTIARRRTSNTPLQALALLNDQQYLETYEGMAYLALQESNEVTEQIAHLYRLGLRRTATAEELALLNAHYQRSLQRYIEDPAQVRDYLSAGMTTFTVDDEKQAEFAALASTARIIMNSPDAYTRR